MTLYQLIAYGPLTGSGGLLHGRVHSCRVFKTEEEAADFAPEFRKSVLNRSEWQLAVVEQTLIVALTLEPTLEPKTH